MPLKPQAPLDRFAAAQQQFIQSDASGGVGGLAMTECPSEALIEACAWAA
jgi:hypothetical protein